MKLHMVASEHRFIHKRYRTVLNIATIIVQFSSATNGHGLMVTCGDVDFLNRETIMSEVTLTILAGDKKCTGHLHGGTVDRIVAALAADPANLSELHAALLRFYAEGAQPNLHTQLRSGDNYKKWDAGIVCLDLTGRTICYESTYSLPARNGSVAWMTSEGASEHQLNYRLASDWEILSCVDQFRWSIEKRRRVSTLYERKNERKVLYESVIEFILDETPKRFLDSTEEAEETAQKIVQLHRDWLLTPCPGIKTLSPREVLLDDRNDHIRSDIDSQQMNWSILQQPQPGLSRTATAYEHGGFGTHEFVMYYDYVRELIWEAVERLRVRKNNWQLKEESDHLQRRAQDWLHTPLPEFHNRTPASIIDKERRRLPEAVTGDEAVIDPECPCCQMMAEDSDFGPVFWHLDGCEMEDEFAFSMYHKTKKDWEDEQMKWDK